MPKAVLGRTAKRDNEQLRDLYFEDSGQLAGAQPKCKTKWRPIITRSTIISS